MRFPTMKYVQPANSNIRAFASRLNMIVKLLTKHHLEFLSLKRGCIGSYESTLAKMPRWVSHVAAQFMYDSFSLISLRKVELE